MSACWCLLGYGHCRVLSWPRSIFDRFIGVYWHRDIATYVGWSLPPSYVYSRRIPRSIDVSVCIETKDTAICLGWSPPPPCTAVDRCLHIGVYWDRDIDVYLVWSLQTTFVYRRHMIWFIVVSVCIKTNIQKHHSPSSSSWSSSSSDDRGHTTETETEIAVIRGLNIRPSVWWKKTMSILLKILKRKGN